MTDTRYNCACVIVNFNRTKETVRCIKSLKDDAVSKLIVLVDNGSSDQRILEKEIHAVEGLYFLPLPRNCGFAEGANKGIMYALSREHIQYVFLINNDAWIIDHALSKMCAYMQEHEGVAIVSPKIYFSDHKTIWSAGGQFHYFRLTAGNRGMGKADGNLYTKQEYINFASGCAMLVRADIFRTVGYFDPQYVNYYEDVDLCIRVRRAGYAIAYYPDAQVLHEGSLSAGAEYGDFISFYRYRNRLILLKKYGNMPQILFNIFFLPILCVRDAVCYVCTGKISGYVRLWQGVFDFFLIRRNDPALLEKARKQ